MPDKIKLLRLTEIAWNQADNSTREKSTYFNIEGIVTIQQAKFERTGAVIIGQNSNVPAFVSLISLTTGRVITVKETPAQVCEAVDNLQTHGRQSVGEVALEEESKLVNA